MTNMSIQDMAEARPDLAGLIKDWHLMIFTCNNLSGLEHMLIGMVRQSGEEGLVLITR